MLRCKTLSGHVEPITQTTAVTNRLGRRADWEINLQNSGAGGVNLVFAGKRAAPPALACGSVKLHKWFTLLLHEGCIV